MTLIHLITNGTFVWRYSALLSLMLKYESNLYLECTGNRGIVSTDNGICLSFLNSLLIWKAFIYGNEKRIDKYTGRK